MTIAIDMGKNNSDVGNVRNRGFSLVEVLMTTVIIIVLAAIGIPTLMSMVRGLRTAGDARDLNGAIIQAKMRAASDFSRTRVYADLSANTFRIEIQPSGTTSWTTDCPSTCDQPLSSGVSFGYGSLSSPPANTQAALGQATACKDSSNTSISNTACVIFNSRGIPITSGTSPAPTPTGEDALYVTDGKSVTGVTVSITGLSRIWRTDASAANWQKQ
jgi:prepilin-type N-terminal cleavage/methylation domain-containing protein